jgi:cell division protein FtsI (penicillin-binding protein 3)
MKIKTNILLRIYFVFGIIFVAGLLVLWQAFSIQQYKDGYWEKKADALSTRQFSIPAERGNIYSTDERLLATSLPYFDVYMDLAADGMTQQLFESNIDALAGKLASTFKDKSKETWKREITKARVAKKRYYPIRRNVDYALMKEMKQWPLFKEGKYKGGLIAEMQQKRKYPYEVLANRTIGYVRENAPSIGLEASYNAYLSGTDGRVLKQKLAGDVWMPIPGAAKIDPKNGKDVISTLQINLQDAAETALMTALQESASEFGCAIVMEVQTGAIRAMANLGLLQDGSYGEIRNYAISHRAEPGSTFKLASYLMLLDAKYIKPTDTIHTGGGKWRFYDRYMRDDHIAEDFLSIKEAFARSSNIAIARLANRHFASKKQMYYKKLQEYGLTEVTGIDLEGEVPPIISKPDKWSKLSLPWMSTGYELMLTPLQILTFYNAVANNGVIMKPYLVEAVVDGGKRESLAPGQSSQKPFASEQAIQYAHFLLRQVVDHPKGTARGIASEYFPLAGKTGTAKLLNAEDQSYGTSNQAMFAGFFPADNPRYSCVVLIYNPQGISRTGGSVAAPAFKAIAEKALATDIGSAKIANSSGDIKVLPSTQIKGEPQQLKALLANYGYTFEVGDDIQYLGVKVDRNGIKLMPAGSKEGVMPDLIGMAFDDAIYLLENQGLRIRFEGRGKVVAQSKAPGSKVQRGETIHIKMRINA